MTNTLKPNNYGNICQHNSKLFLMMGLLRLLDCYIFLRRKKNASTNKLAMAATIVNSNPEAHSAPS
jgi:hypothetical protein